MEEFVSRYAAFALTCNLPTWTDILQRAQSLVSNITASLELETAETYVDYGLRAPLRFEGLTESQSVAGALSRRTTHPSRDAIEVSSENPSAEGDVPGGSVAQSQPALTDPEADG